MALRKKKTTFSNFAGLGGMRKRLKKNSQTPWGDSGGGQLARCAHRRGGTRIHGKTPPHVPTKKNGGSFSWDARRPGRQNGDKADSFKALLLHGSLSG